MFFDVYIENGIDFFCLDRTIKDWSEAENTYSIKYENFKKKEKEINLWLDKPLNYKELKWKQRKSKRDFLSQSVLKRLIRMYGSQIEAYENMESNNQFYKN